MTIKVVDVDDLNEIVLTNNGLVVGHIHISRMNSDIDFRGQAVNYRTRISLTNPNYNPSTNTNNGFGCGFSIDKSSLDEMQVDNYLAVYNAS